MNEEQNLKNLILMYSGKNKDMMDGLRRIEVFKLQTGIEKYMTGLELYNNGWRSAELNEVLGL